MWTPGGAATPPPCGEVLDIIKLPLEKTGFERGYLINRDRALLASFELEVGDLVVAIGKVDLRGAGGVERMLETANELLTKGGVVNALVRRGGQALPTYVMRASYRRPR